MPAKKAKPVQATLLLYEGKHMESLWVRPISGGKYRLAAIPFYAYNVSLGDVVRCGPDEDGIGLFIEEVLAKSGNRTVRVAFWAKEGGNHPEAIKFKEFLMRVGLPWDYDGVRLISINIASDEALEIVTARMQDFSEEAQMKWEEGDPQPERNLDGSIAENDG